jgi:hypothetical protein
VSDIREEASRLQEQFIDQAVVLRELRQDRRYAAGDDVVMAAEGDPTKGPIAMHPETSDLHTRRIVSEAGESS